MIGASDAWLVDQRWFKAYPLGESTTIGRGPDNTIILRDPAVSRVHVEIGKAGEAYVLRTMGSSGTKVNGTRVSTECVLQEGDVIEIAFSALRFTRRAPTGEMFVVRRDAEISTDRIDIPTRATLHAMHPLTIASRWRHYWHYALIAGLVLLLVTLCANAGAR